MPTILLLTLLLSSTTICYIDRQALSIAAPTLRARFSMSNFTYSKVLFAFLLAYAIFSPIMGRFIDWMGTRLGLALAVVFWSVASVLHATARGAFSFGVFRFMLGVGEAGNFPACVKVVAEQIPAELRALGTGVFNVGAGLGAIIAPPLIAWLILKWGWQAAFVATGTLGILWVLTWLLFYQSKWYSAAAKTESNPYKHQAGRSVLPWKALLGYREVWALMVARFISDPAWYFYLFWLPEYLHSVRGFNLQQIGYFAWVPFLTADLGSVAGGWLSAFLMRRGWSLDKARKVAMAGCAACMPFTIAAGYVSDVSTTIAFISLATFAHQAWTANMITLPADLFPPKVVASVYGLSAFSSSVGAMIFMLVVGWTVDHFSYTSVFLSVGLMHPIAVAVLFLMIPRLELVHTGPAASTEPGT